MINHVRAAIQNAGIPISDEVFQEALEYSTIPDNQKFEGVYTEAAQRFALDLLVAAGMGDYDEDTCEWTPTSREVYAFDAEIFDVSNMYALFLKGVQSIVPDVVITDVVEDLSLTTDDITESDDNSEPPSDGERSVSFLCNGNKYETKLKSYCDWLNMDILSFVNDVLKQENCEKQLHLLTIDDFDQMCVLIYGSEERAKALLSVLRD